LIVTLTVAGVFQPPDGAAAIVIHDEFEDGVKEMGVIPSPLVKVRLAVTGLPPACASRLRGFGVTTKTWA
jgi:hypothetical protein